jgi:hypothetical protein
VNIKPRKAKDRARSRESKPGGVQGTAVEREGIGISSVFAMVAGEGEGLSQESGIVKGRYHVEKSVSTKASGAIGRDGGRGSGEIEDEQGDTASEENEEDGTEDKEEERGVFGFVGVFESKGLDELFSESRLGGRRSEGAAIAAGAVIFVEGGATYMG